MSDSLVSIVIPFFNEERFIERAIDSAIAQTYSSIEIILVNDGSEDRSATIAQRYCDAYPHVSLITTENLGLSSARNTGISRSQGEFITFLDADDALEEKAVEVLVSKINQESSDLVMCKFTLFNKKREGFKEAGWRLKNPKIDGARAAEQMYTGGIASVAWGKLYRAKVFRKVLFPVGLWFEDRPYVLECFLNTDKLSFIDASLLKIYSNEDSITRRIVTEKRIIDLYLIYIKEIQILERYNKVKELSPHVINHHIDVLLDLFFLLLIDNQRMQNSKSCRKLFREYFLKFTKHYGNYPNLISKKRKVILILFNGLRYLPWSLISILATFTFRKKFAGVQLLKTS